MNIHFTPREELYNGIQRFQELLGVYSRNGKDSTLS